MKIVMQYFNDKGLCEFFVVYTKCPTKKGLKSMYELLESDMANRERWKRQRSKNGKFIRKG